MQQVVVAGAGILGCSTGLHLARRGAKVCIVDPGGSNATKASWAWLNASKKRPQSYKDLNMAGMAEWAASFPHLVHPKGSLLLDDATPSTDKKYPCEAMTAEAAAEAEPSLSATELQGRTVHRYAQEAWVDPQRACASMLEEARSLGARLLLSDRLDELIVEADDARAAAGSDGSAGNAARRVVGARTASGMTLEADCVVLTCGVGAPALAAAAGVGLPLAHKPARIATTSALPPGTLGCMLCSPDVFVVQRPDGSFLLGSPAESADEDVKPAFGRSLLAAAEKLLPALRGVQLVSVQVAYRPYPVDGHPLVGFAADGLYVCVTHSGMTLGPHLGRLVAGEVASQGRELAPELSVFRPDRAIGADSAYGWHAVTAAPTRTT